MSLLQIFDPRGKKLTDISATLSREWALSKSTRSEFRIATKDPKCRKDFIKPGNIVVVEHESLPAWGGFMYPPFEWQKDILEVTVLSMEEILRYRRGPSTLDAEGVGGAIFTQLLDLANQQGDTLIRAGNIYMGDLPIVEPLNLTDIFGAITSLCRKTGGEWSVRPEKQDGQLVFYADYFQRAGEDKRNIVLRAGHNIKGEKLIQSTPLLNDITVFSSGATWDSKGSANATDENSIAAYGLFQGIEAVNDSSDAAALSILANQYPARATFEVLKNAWQNVRLGDVFTVRLHNAGFSGQGIGWEGTHRVMVMKYNESDKTLEVGSEETNG